MDETNEQRQQRIKKLDHCGGRRGAVRHAVRGQRSGRRLIKLHGEKTKERSSRKTSPVPSPGAWSALRRFGKAAFAVLQDGADRLQIYLKKDRLLNRPTQ